MLFAREPTMVIGALRMVIVLAAAFGLKLKPKELVAVYTATEALLSWLNRRKVTPAE